MAKFRAAYQPLGETRRPTIHLNKEPSMVKGSFAKELDVNNIIKKYNKTGILQKANQFEGEFGEFASYDLREAIEKVQNAETLFMEVPSKIRAQFDNDAGAFIDYATNPQNIEQMREWNMAPRDTNPPTEGEPAPPTPQPVEMPSEPPTEPTAQ